MNEAERHRALEALYQAHSAPVHASACRRTDRAAADDVVSEVFAIAWRRLDDIPTAAPLPWLLACARRVLANQRRIDRRAAALRTRLAATGRPSVNTDESGGALREALSQLREPDREALFLTAWEGLTPAEAAVVLGCSRGAFNVRLHRARRRLEARLARLENGAPVTETVEAVS